MFQVERYPYTHRILGWVLFGLLATGCSTAAEQGGGMSDKDPASRDAGLMNFVGAMRWIELEGGFWGIVAPNGSKYLPTQTLPESVQKEGLPVRGTLRLRKGVMTLQMWGSPVEVVTIEASP